jgi:hypothetical protein
MAYRRPQDRYPLYDEPEPRPSLLAQIITFIAWFALALAVGAVVLSIIEGGLVSFEESSPVPPGVPTAAARPTIGAPTPQPQPTRLPSAPQAAPASLSQPIPVPPLPDPALQPGQIIVLQTPTPEIIPMVATVVVEQPSIPTDTPPWIVGEPGSFPTADPAPHIPDPPPAIPYVEAAPTLAGTQLDSQCGGDNPPLVCAP